MAGSDDEAARGAGTEGAADGHAFLRRVVLCYAVGVVFLAVIALLWVGAKVLLVIFAGILLAILLGEASCLVQKRLGLSRAPALALVLAALAVVLVGLGWLLAPGVGDQAAELADALPRSLQRLQASLQRYRLLRDLAGSLPSPQTIVSYASSMLGRVGVFFSGVLGALASAVIVVFVGIYFAARPASYIDGLVVLMPIGKRKRTREVLHEIGRILGQWLIGKLLSMLIIGLLTALALALLQVPLALLLGLLAGLLDFVPYIGPILAGVPAVLIAFAESPTLALYVLLVFVALQGAEGYLVLPLIERRTVSLPPALTIVMQTLLGSCFGLLGIALATPLTAAVTVLVAMLYVQDSLGDPVRLPGDSPG